MLRLTSPDEARRWCAECRARGARTRSAPAPGLAPTLGFVPTMGALHEGHLGLVRRAARECAKTCVSIFVNPLQFDDPGDFERYPRDFEGDARQLESVGCHMVFTGTLQGFFPGLVGESGEFGAALVDPGPMAAGLEGEFRPGHFAGMATIVERLFELVEPDRAYFGQKDFQQALIVTGIARRRGRPEIVVCPTAREPSGLALSSRNALLSAAERTSALGVSRALRRARELWDAGERHAAPLARAMRAEIEAAGLGLEYATVRDPGGWTAGEPAGALERAVALVAARSGRVRLIDNLRLAPRDPSLP